MSELLQVAASLRKFSDQDLRQLAIERSVATSQMRDFFDFAESLTQTKSIASAIAGLPRSLALGLRHMADGKPIANDVLLRLQRLALADDSGLFASVAAAVPDTSAQLHGLPDELEPLMIDQVDRDAGHAVFETLQALTELVFELEQRYIREVGKGNVGLPDVKRLAAHLSKTNDYAKEIYALAAMVDLMTLVHGRWQFGPAAPKWLTSTPTQQIEILWKVWIENVGLSALSELVLEFKNSKSNCSISSLFESVYPFADSAVGTRIAKLEKLTERLGLAAGNQPASWFGSVMQQRLDEALNWATMRLPASESRLICQADLTLISTGPLPIETEIQLRKFADTEGIGMASTYRLTPLSLTHGLETGLTEAGIRKLLESLSGKSLPQPIDYLLKETSNRFGRLFVTEGNELDRAVINSTDPVLLAEILNDGDLKAFSLVRQPDQSVTSRFEPEVVYFGLREAGYAAIRKDHKGKVISPLKSIGAAEAKHSEDSILVDIARMREQEDRVGIDLADDEIQRKIQLAIKNKAKVEVKYIAKSGDELLFLLEPIGIANGRLRARDKKADIERTLPISSITAVSII
jgi:hypothetical protein